MKLPLVGSPIYVEDVFIMLLLMITVMIRGPRLLQTTTPLYASILRFYFILDDGCEQIATLPLSPPTDVRS